MKERGRAWARERQQRVVLKWVSGTNSGNSCSDSDSSTQRDCSVNCNCNSNDIVNVAAFVACNLFTFVYCCCCYCFNILLQLTEKSNSKYFCFDILWFFILFFFFFELFFRVFVSFCFSIVVCSRPCFWISYCCCYCCYCEQSVSPFVIISQYLSSFVMFDSSFHFQFDFHSPIAKYTCHINNNKCRVVIVVVVLEARLLLVSPLFFWPPKHFS